MDVGLGSSMVELLVELLTRVVGIQSYITSPGNIYFGICSLILSYSTCVKHSKEQIM